MRIRTARHNRGKVGASRDTISIFFVSSRDDILAICLWLFFLLVRADHQCAHWNHSYILDNPSVLTSHFSYHLQLFFSLCSSSCSHGSVASTIASFRLPRLTPKHWAFEDTPHWIAKRSWNPYCSYFFCNLKIFLYYSSVNIVKRVLSDLSSVFATSRNIKVQKL